LTGVFREAAAQNPNLAEMTNIIDLLSVDSAEIDAMIANEAALQKMYPDINLAISFCSIEEQDAVVSPRDTVILKNAKTCACRTGRPKISDFIEVRRRGGGVTYRDIFETLNRERYGGECGHNFLEGIRAVAGSDVQFQMVLGT